jgi:hypothetical protein
MGGEALEEAELGWHGLASKLPDLILFAAVRRGANTAGSLPTHVRTPGGQELALFGEELAAEVGLRHGSPVEMTHLDRGIFDEASVSAITSATVGELAGLVGHRPDVRRFRPNVLISSQQSDPFEEDGWVGGVFRSERVKQPPPSQSPIGTSAVL